jgi:hypothetical protein
MTPSITDFPAGHVFEPFSLNLSAEKSRAYRDAVGDALPFYDEAGVVPPLAVAALALGEILQRVGLPPGTLHGSESVESQLAVPAGTEVECRASIAQRSQRSGWIATVLLAEVAVGGDVAVSARSTVLSPG